MTTKAIRARLARHAATERRPRSALRCALARATILVAAATLLGALASCEPADNPEPAWPTTPAPRKSPPSTAPATFALRVLVAPDPSGQSPPIWALEVARDAVRRAGHNLVELKSPREDAEPGEDPDLLVLVGSTENGITLSAREPESRRPLAAEVARPSGPPGADARRSVAMALSRLLGSEEVRALQQAVRERRKQEAKLKGEWAAERSSEAAREQDAWAKLDLDGCKAAAQRGACDGVRKHVMKHPKGAHADEARALLSAYELRLPEIKDDEDWQAAPVSKCQSAKQDEDCAGVRAYLAAHPDGKHAGEARAALAQGAASIRAARDEELWGSARAADCRAASTDDACDGVQRYLREFTAGAHSKEANEALDAGMKKIEARDRQREAQQRVAACLAKCKGICGRNPSDACIQGCRQRECK